MPGTPFLAGATTFAPSKLSLLESFFGFASNFHPNERSKISFLMFLPSAVDAVPYLVFGPKFA